MKFLSKLKKFFIRVLILQDPEKTPISSSYESEQSDGIKKTVTKDGVDYSINLNSLLKNKKRDISSDYVFSVDEQIEKLPIISTNNGKFRKIKGSVKPTEVAVNKFGTFIGMCEIEDEDITAWGEGPNNEKELFDELYAKDLAKLIKLKDKLIPFLAYVFTDFNYLDSTNAYYFNEDRIDMIFYLGDQEKVKEIMKEDLAQYNKKAEENLIERKNRYYPAYS